jgi:protein TonB
MQPTEEEKAPQQMKIIEIALVTEVKPKVESPPPAPAKATPPKKELPKKKVVEPPLVKKKTPVIHKEGEIPRPKMVTKESTPSLPMPVFPTAKKETSATNAPSLPGKTAAKPAANPGAGNSQSVNSGIVELGCPKPKYPMRAMSRHIEGWVKIEMTIDADGRVSNARVAGSEPSGIFDDAALAAIKNCKFKPRLVNGKAVAQRGVKKSTFKLTN